MNNAIEVEDLSKVYRLGEIGTGTISRDLHRWAARMMGKEDPFLKVGELNDRTRKGDADIVYSLKGLTFSVPMGQTVGIIGRNGAGKSTLLKILSRVTSPTKGEVRVRGRIASLLEVGTGFHPELTGRENIYLNSAILGMKTRETAAKFDAIVDFSGVERYIDTPVKRYSSGMYVRLAFAVAAHLESEILIVDEVLAVGDSDFQTKCLGKMRSVSHDEGRTVLFVSHNMASVKTLCNHGIMLANGQIEAQGNMNDVIIRYLASTEKNLVYENIPESVHLYASGQIYFRSLLIRSIHTDTLDAIPFNSPIVVEFSVECNSPIHQLFFDLKIVSREGMELSFCQSNWSTGEYHRLEKGFHRFRAETENQFQPGNYFITIGAHLPDGTTVAYLENIVAFEVLTVSYNNEENYAQQWKHGYFRPRTKWESIA